MQTVEIVKNSITKLDTETIVNAANKYLRHGAGVCGYIFDAAGPRKLQEACDKIGGCPTGSAVITPGFELCKYVVHAVGPEWNGGNSGEPEQLYSCYRKSLDLAKKNGSHSIGFPLISAGIFGYPVYEAWGKAVEAIYDWAKENADYEIRIVFAVLDDKILKTGKNILADKAPGLMLVKKSDWKTEEMPEQRDHFNLLLSVSDKQLDILRHGHLPREMEDKWFWYMEGDTLYAHRSWTGFCIYVADFSEKGKIKVTVNRDHEQYKCKSIEEDRDNFSELLFWWIQEPYDHYSEWLSETAKAIERAGLLKDTLIINNTKYDAVFFHKPEEPHGYLSNWYLSDFVVDGIKFTSNEQYIMYRKCLLFGDVESANEVLSTDDPEKQQSIGRKAKGFDQKLWEGARQVIAIRGLFAKFEQNEDLKKKLLDTGNAYLVECAGSDKIWACGIRLDDPDRFDQSNWKGTNLLGFALMEVREFIRAKEQ